MSSGFRIFETLELAEALGCAAVVTLNSEEDPGDLADLIEYAYGTAATKWGAQRIADGHRL